MAATIVGRHAELALVAGFLDTVGNRPSALLLEGEAGIGKTIVWRQALDDARARGHTVLACHASGAEVQLSFAALGDLLDEVLPAALPDIPAPQRKALEVALLLSEDEQTPDLRAIGLAVLGVVRSLARRAPLLLAIDDLQWLDAPTGQAVAFAVRRLRDEPVGLLATIRCEQGDPAPFELDRAFASHAFTRHWLGPLSVAALHEMLGSRLGMTVSRPTLLRLHETSGGNPFFALEIAGALRRSGLDPAPGQPLPLPSNLRELIRGRLAILPDDAGRTLLAAATLSQPTVGLLEQAGASPGQVALDLERLTAAGLIEISGERVRFSHPLIASVSYGNAPPFRRREMHGHLARVVSDQEERARHMALAAVEPDAGVAAALDEAARLAARRGAVQIAAELTELAMRLTPAGRDDELVGRTVSAAGFHAHGGNPSRTRELLHALIERMPAGVRRAEAILLLADVQLDDLDAAVRLSEQAIEEARGSDDITARAWIGLGMASAVRGDVASGLKCLERAHEFAERSDDPLLISRALSLLARFEVWAGRVTPGLIDRALATEERASHATVYESARTTLALWLMYQDRVDEARDIMEAQIEQAGERGEEFSRIALLMHLTELECRAGAFEAADARSAQGMAYAEMVGAAHQGSASMYVRALACMWRGRIDEARQLSTRGVLLASDSSDEVFRLQNVIVLGILELSVGNAAEAVSILEPIPDHLLALGWREPTVFPVWPNAIEALIVTGELSRAKELLDRYDAIIASMPSPWALATAQRCRGLLAAARGDLDAADVAFERALVEHDALPNQFERGRTLLAYGVALRRGQRRRDAREALQAALAIFDRHGASVWANRATEELRRVSGRVAAGDDLTPSEQRVAALVAQGRTNREVAAELFVTERTVEGHLTNIYAKLGVRSRAELARVHAGHPPLDPLEGS